MSRHAEGAPRPDHGITKTRAERPVTTMKMETHAANPPPERGALESVDTTNAIRVLILEDNPADTELVVDELQRAGFRLSWKAVASARDYALALDSQAKDGPFDLILADHSLPGYDALGALAELKRRDGDIPFIIITGSLGDEDAAACIREGATDFLLKDRLKRLGSAVTRALTEHRAADKQARMQDALRQARQMAAEALRTANATLEQRIAERSKELVEANERLRLEMAERQRAQQIVQQSQKLQATGQLAAGVAHHFNNLLTVVMGSIEMALPGAADERSRRRLTNALQAAERGAGLTRQLLSFARRQIVSPEVIEPSRRLCDMVMLFSGSLGSKIVVESDVPDDLWPVEVDVAELELAVLNLAFNARDAMPSGGTLRFSAKNVTVNDDRLDLLGRHLLIELADSGSGISADVMARIYEPFYTTKEVGEGSGLGLSQVHGFAHQAGGAIDIQSEIGSGAIVRLYLPVATALATAADHRDQVTPESIPSGRVLVVDDDVAVADIGAQMLRQHGFNVEIAHNAQDALDILTSRPPFDLLLSDIVMPGGINGIELAARVRAQFPTLPILLATGHSDSVKDASDKGIPIIAKPFLSAQLLGHVTSLLRSTTQASTLQ